MFPCVSECTRVLRPLLNRLGPGDVGSAFKFLSGGKDEETSKGNSFQGHFLQDRNVFSMRQGRDATA